MQTFSSLLTSWFLDHTITRKQIRRSLLLVALIPIITCLPSPWDFILSLFVCLLVFMSISRVFRHADEKIIKTYDKMSKYEKDFMDLTYFSQSNNPLLNTEHLSNPEDFYSDTDLCVLASAYGYFLDGYTLAYTRMYRYSLEAEQDILDLTYPRGDA